MKMLVGSPIRTTCAVLSVAAEALALSYIAAPAQGWTVWKPGSVNTAYENAFGITLDGNGDVIACGIQSNNGTGPSDFYVVKLRGFDGAELWGLSPAIDGQAHFQDYAYSVAVDSTNNVISGGYLTNNASKEDGFITKLASANGSILWTQLFNGTNFSGKIINGAGNGNDKIETQRAIVVDASGAPPSNNVYVAGRVRNAAPPPTPTPWPSDFTVLQFDSNGNELRRTTVWQPGTGMDPSGLNVGYAVAVDSGNVYAAGTIKYADRDFAVAKVRPIGTPTPVAWVYHRSGTGLGSIDAATALTVVNSGIPATPKAIFATGYLNQGLAVVKLLEASSGLSVSEDWVYSPQDTSYPYSTAGSNTVIVDPSGDVIVAGTIQALPPPNGSGTEDLFVVKLRGTGPSKGTEIWRTVINGTWGGDDEAKDIAWDQAGNIVVVGATNLHNAEWLGGPEGFAVAKLRPSDGSLVWPNGLLELEGTKLGAENEAWRVTIDNSSQDILAAGYLENGTTGEDFAVARIGACSGDASVQCGDGIAQPGEACDDGGKCVGGSNPNAKCPARVSGGVDCAGGGVCTPQSGDWCSKYCRAECVGDCNADGVVTQAEYDKAYQIAQGTAPLSNCYGADGNNSCEVEVNELIAAQSNKNNGCTH